MFEEVGSSFQADEDEGGGYDGAPHRSNPDSIFAGPSIFTSHHSTPSIPAPSTTPAFSPLRSNHYWCETTPNRPDGDPALSRLDRKLLPRVHLAHSSRRSTPRGGHPSLILSTPLVGASTPLTFPETHPIDIAIVLPSSSRVSSPVHPCGDSEQTPTQTVFSPVRFHRPLRLALGAFCMLNAVIAFLFTWMMITRQTVFALTAAKRRWDLELCAKATCRAGFYYFVIGIVLLVDRVNRIFAVLLQLGMRCAQAISPWILCGPRWCTRRMPWGRVCGPRRLRLFFESRSISPERETVAMRTKLIRSPPSDHALLSTVDVSATRMSRGPLLRSAGRSSHTEYRSVLPNSTLRLALDSDLDGKPLSSSSASRRIRRRGA